MPWYTSSRYSSQAASLAVVLCISSCQQQVFDPNEELHALPGVEAELELVSGAEYAVTSGIGGVEPGSVFVRQTIRNGSSHRLKVYATPLLQANRIVVRTLDGDEAELTPDGNKFRYPRRGDVGASYVEPGQEKESIYPLSRLFDLSAPGGYAVEVSTRYTVPGLSGGYFSTDPEPLTFTIPSK